jgi:leucyl aminopeptidase
MKIIVVDKKLSRKKCTCVVLNEKIRENRFVVNKNTQVLEIKVQKKEDMNRRKWIILVRSIIREAKKYDMKRIEIIWKDLVNFDNLGQDLGQVFAEAVYMAHYEFRKYKKEPKEKWPDVNEVVLIADKNDKTIKRQDIRKGVTIATQINFCRDMSNTPGADMTPTTLVSATRKAIKGTKIKMRVLDEKQMRRKKMNGILAVGQGSSHQSRFIILEYIGTLSNKKPTVLVGKGVTFDTGGIDTKPHPHGLEMMMDMSGAAAVLSTIVSAAKLQINKNIIALMPVVENMPGGSSYRPGDIITMMDGTHVEVGHTDAEGRLILADAITYAKMYEPALVVDVATLTGAAVVALGERASAIFTKDDQLANQTLKLGENVGDYVWRMPLWDEYDVDISGTYGDIANINTKTSPGNGGAITAAIFLKNFAKDYKKWMHIDIAPTMVATFDEQLAKGAKGSAVRLLVKLLEQK